MKPGKLRLSFKNGTRITLIKQIRTDIELLNKEITDKELKAFYAVYNELGFGFLEKVYKNAMVIELHKLGLDCAKQHPIKVKYEGI